ncbi:MAG: universal stress protein [Thermodesulfobacteriota bacterium]
MYKKILFNTCLTDYCDHIFNFVVNLAKENNAKLWIHHGLGRLNYDDEAKVVQEIKKAEEKASQAYVQKMQDRGFTDYAINVTDGDVVSETSKLARNAGIDVLVMGTSTNTPIATGGTTNIGPLGKTTAEALLWAPCPVLVVPPALIPGLASGK